MGFPWQSALGAVFISGCCFLVVSLLGVREKIMNAIPPSLRTAIPAGVGLFLALISLKNSGIVVANPATFVTLGDLHKPEPVLAIIGFLTIVALDRLRVTGALLIGIMVVTALSFVFGGNEFRGIVAPPPSIEPTFMQLDVVGAVSKGLLNVVLVFFLVELFDATGTLMGVAQRAGLMKEGKMPPGMNKALLADSGAIIAGSVMGTSSTTAFIESAAGVQAGGRTGLTAVTIAVLFLLALFIAPLAGVVPAYATAPALFFVACLMLRELTEINWAETTESIPAVITALVMPFTYSIANGLALGFISYAGLKLLTGKHREVSLMLWGIAGIFLFKTIYLPG
ncbi:putative MFS transporter, AGZA family, xanthine/uracil permease [Pseudoduganella namucuonensis]|uniref:Putative MFS transporter, AGZA family, xanthine/uracil permease n=2 Tax=Pseudoduganella namucuonensis TaxID=1035707 RepID=A0A1I7K7N5_9BURK|nr:putative MFS transporter, AGZA family, xanthine/uracil permease [Pseudoduganella namucuonensis]